MSDFEIYVFILCIIVFTALTAVFTVMIVFIGKLSVKLIRSGAEDEKIKTEYEKEKAKKKSSKFWSIVDKAVSGVVCCVIIVIFALSLFVNVTGDGVTGDIPTVQVVQSASMSEKHEKNEYLVKNKLHDQLQTFDIIVTHKLPDEFDLELYDIVVYELENVLLVHRIVGIEEPNEKHSERYFKLQGDAIENPDRFPVRYEQMKGIYQGERIPMIGSFVSFMQSPAGWLCILLTLFAMIASPIVDKKLMEVREARLQIILANEQAQAAQTAQVAPVQAVADTQPQSPAQTLSLNSPIESFPPAPAADPAPAPVQAPELPLSARALRARKIKKAWVAKSIAPSGEERMYSVRCPHCFASVQVKRRKKAACICCGKKFALNFR